LLELKKDEFISWAIGQKTPFEKLDSIETPDKQKKATTESV